MVKKIRMKESDIKIIKNLNINLGLTKSKLVQKSGLSRPTITESIRRLKRKGIVKNIGNRGSRRKYVLNVKRK